MKIIVKETKEQGSQVAVDLITQAHDRGAKVFGLATGSSPEKVYDILSKSEIDFSDSVSINLDEYIGLGPDHDQSYNYFMNKQLFQYKPFKASHIPNGLNDKEAEVKRYEQVLAENPIDLQLLGIGANGHIAFNEPGTPFDSVTHVEDLTDSTIQANKRFFNSEDEVPRQAFTMGLKSIMRAKQIVLLAFGENKAQALKNLVETTQPTTDIPSTILNNHPDVTVIADLEAAQLIDVALTK